MSANKIIFPMRRRGATGAVSAVTQETIDKLNVMRSARLVSNFVYWSQTGNDGNNGTINNPVRTWARVAELLQTGSNVVYTDGECWFESVERLIDMNVTFIKNATSSSSSLRSRNVAGTPVPGGIVAYGRCAVAVTGLNLVLDNDSTSFFAAFNVEENGSLSLSFRNVSFFQSGTNTAVLLQRAIGGILEAEFFNSPISPITGKVMSGVASGANPNSTFARFSITAA